MSVETSPCSVNVHTYSAPVPSLGVDEGPRPPSPPRAQALPTEAKAVPSTTQEAAWHEPPGAEPWVQQRWPPPLRVADGLPGDLGHTGHERGDWLLQDCT